MDSEGKGSDVSVGRGARIEGILVSVGSLRIDGQLNGEISAEGEAPLPRERGGGNIRAESITLGGRVAVNLTAPGDVPPG